MSRQELQSLELKYDQFFLQNRFTWFSTYRQYKIKLNGIYFFIFSPEGLDL